MYNFFSNQKIAAERDPQDNNRRTSAEQPTTAQAPGFAPASPAPQPPKQRAAANKRSAKSKKSKTAVCPVKKPELPKTVFHASHKTEFSWIGEYGKKVLF